MFQRDAAVALSRPPSVLDDVRWTDAAFGSRRRAGRAWPEARTDGIRRREAAWS